MYSSKCPGPVCIQAALRSHQSIEGLVLSGGWLLEQRDIAWTKPTEILGWGNKPAARCMRFPGWVTSEVYDTTTTSNRARICCCRRRSWSPRAPGSTGPHRIICAFGDAAMVPRSGGRHRAAG